MTQQVTTCWLVYLNDAAQLRSPTDVHQAFAVSTLLLQSVVLSVLVWQAADLTSVKLIIIRLCTTHRCTTASNCGGGACVPLLCRAGQLQALGH